MLLVTTVRFDQSTYSVSENNRQVQPVLVLNKPLSFIIAIQILSTDMTTSGKHCSVQNGLI